MNLSQLIHRDAEHSRRVSVVGDLYSFLVEGAESGGRYALFEALVPPGGGPPPHIHTREIEAFFIIDGELVFHAEDQTLKAGSGQFLQIPIGMLHSFRNESDAVVRMLILVAPAGLDQFFLEVGTPSNVPLPPSQEEIQRLLATAPRYGIEIHAPH